MVKLFGTTHSKMPTGPDIGKLFGTTLKSANGSALALGFVRVPTQRPSPQVHRNAIYSHLNQTYSACLASFLLYIILILGHACPQS